jgi:four helix bundle protein
MPKATFETLPVYQLAERLADEVWNIVDGWGAFAQETVGKRLVRSADRIARDIAVGAGRTHVREKKRFLLATRRALHETRHWLRRAYRRGLLTQEQIDRLRPLLDELAARLHPPKPLPTPRRTGGRPRTPAARPRTRTPAPPSAGKAPEPPPAEKPSGDASPGETPAEPEALAPLPGDATPEAPEPSAPETFSPDAESGVNDEAKPGEAASPSRPSAPPDEQTTDADDDPTPPDDEHPNA